MIKVSYVTPEDRDFWYTIDKDLPEEMFAAKIRDQAGYVLFADGVPAGLLRYNLLWENTPMCTLLFVENGKQKKGYGRMLMEHWEKDMAAQGYDLVMTSTQVDEEAQHFYRKLGYKDCGALVLDIPGHEQPMEMFLYKKIG